MPLSNPSVAGKLRLLRHAPRWFARGVGAVALASLLAWPGQASPICCPNPNVHPGDCEGFSQASISAQSPEEPGISPGPPAASELAPGSETLPPAETSPGDAQAADSAEKKPGYPRLTHRGQIQFQLDDGSLGSPRATSAFPASNGIGPFPADSRLFVRRFRPAFDLAMSPSFDLQTEFNIDPLSERIQILDVRFNYDLSDNTYLSAGRFKVPFGWEGLRSSRSTNTIERSDMTAALYPERDVGLSITHHEPRLGLFSLGTFLGQPRSNGGVNNHYDILARARFHINDDLRIGISGHTGNFRPDNTQTDLPVRRLGSELQYDSGALKVEAEAIWSDGYNTISRADSKAFGYYAAAIYRLAGPLDLVLHYDRFDPDLDAVVSAFPSNEANARDRKVIGLNYYFDRDLMHRVMLNYELKQDLEGARLHTSGFRLRYQLAW